jgi:hypothetical protein
MDRVTIGHFAKAMDDVRKRVRFMRLMRFMGALGVQKRVLFMLIMLFKGSGRAKSRLQGRLMAEAF